MKFYAFKSQFKENKFPIYVIGNEDPRNESDWNHESYEREFIGVYQSYEEALSNIQIVEPNFSKWEELDDSVLQGETVYVRG